jgi:hypothetical protein
MYTGVAAILVKLHEHHDREMSQEAHQCSRSFTEAASAPAAAVEAPLEPTGEVFAGVGVWVAILAPSPSQLFVLILPCSH